MFLTRLRAYARLSAVRLTLGLLLVFAITTGIAWLGTFWLIQREMNRLVDARLAAQMSEVVEAMQTDRALPQPDAHQEIMVLGGESGEWEPVVSDP